MTQQISPTFKSLSILCSTIALLSAITVQSAWTMEERILPLPGSLDATPVFNSNCPEVVLGEGILLSTMSKTGKKNPGAHLEYSFKGNFDVFLHHIADGKKSGHMEDLYLGLIAYNPSKKPLKLKFLNAASFLSQPDAPFIKLDTKLDNARGNIYAGPGGRVALNHLLKLKQSGWPEELTLGKGEYRLIRALNIPVSDLVPPLNGRNALLKLHTDNPVELAVVALFARKNADGKFKCPDDSDFIARVQEGDLVQPRGLVPSDPKKPGPIKYGRVAGVSIGSTWSSKADNPYQIKSAPSSIVFPIASLAGGTFATNQIQTAKIIRRYSDTAYAAHGNYGVLYDIKIPLKNDTAKTVKVNLSFDCPIKSDEAAIKYMDPPSTMTFFRGTVAYSSDKNEGASHLVLTRGEKGPVLTSFELKAGQNASVTFKLIYPADSTPPQVITFSFE